MFEFLFKYPPAIFAKGKFLLLSGWPLWLLLLLIVAAGAGLFWNMRQRHGLLSNPRAIAIWLAQTALIALVLFMLWHPAISVARLRPQENVVAVLVDHSRSMGIADDGKPRLQSAEDLLNNTLVPDLQKRFQVRMYEFGRDAVRIDEARNLAADENATRIGDSLKHIVSEAGTMPLGAIVVLSDGGDNTGGIDRDTIAQLRALRLPVHTVGFGPDHFAKDIEIVDVAAPARALAQSRLSARVAIRQHGYAGAKVRLIARENDHPISEQEITLKPDAEQSETIVFNAGAAGAHSFQIGVAPVAGEQNTQNNAVVRLVNVAPRKMRILYMEGEPRWEYKFIRRAIEDDPSIEVVTILRTTQNKIYRQGTVDSHELENGFPSKAEELFKYDGLIIGSVEANYFSNDQQAMIRDFADRRGGGVLFLAGRFALSDGGYAKTPMAEMMPLRLPNEKTWSRNFANATLTDAGRESVITRIEEQRDQNIARWLKMPQIANYAVMGAPKPGAVVLMDVAEAGHRPTPLLAIQNYGHGRVGLFATAGSWRWKMLQDHNDRTHSEFWSQLMRWMVTETPGQVLSSTPHQVLPDDTHVPLRVSVRDKNYDTVSGATVQTTIARPDGGSDVIDLKPDPLEPGMYTGEYTADKPGTYVAETTARQDKTDLGRDALTFRREDGVAENFGAAQNRDLLEKLSSDTGGSYYTPSNAKKLSGEVAVSEAGITAHDNLDLWDMPILFLLVILIRGGEWLLRRKWGVV
ncbi:MAG TPA: glutamine amidotransferase [Bryobacteraceae bacterium]|nr:glutamine amidotransferase [Bryobacteraceae bacterium]